MRSRELSQTLLASGAAALEHGASLVGSQPHIAIMVFGIGVEITLKARLAFEHWHLILDDTCKKPEECWSLLRRGALKTVGGDQLLGALMRVLPSAEAQAVSCSSDTLRKIASLRNKAAHFGVHKDDPEHDVAKLSAIILRSWHALQRVSSIWPEQVRSMLGKAWSGIAGHLKQIDAYLETRAAEMVPHLEAISDGGGAVGLCMRCNNMGTSRRTRDGNAVQENACVICEEDSLTVIAPCIECKRPILHALTETPREFAARCLHCKHDGNSNEAGDVSIYNGLLRPKDLLYYRLPSCNECWGLSEVQELLVDKKESVYVCFGCNGVWGDEDLATCGNCDELWVGADLEDSSFLGCTSCSDAIKERWDRY